MSCRSCGRCSTSSPPSTCPPSTPPTHRPRTARRDPAAADHAQPAGRPADPVATTCERRDGPARRRHGVDEDLADRALPDRRPGRHRPGPRRPPARPLPELAAAYADGAVTAAARRGDHRGGHPGPGRGRREERHRPGHHRRRSSPQAARALGPEDTAKAVRRWVAGIDPDGTLDDAAGQPGSSGWPSLPTAASTSPGTWTRSAGNTVHAALEALMNGDRPAGDLRSHGERQGDALVELARRALAAGELPTVRGRARPGPGHHRLVGPLRRTRRPRGHRRRAGLRRADLSRDRPPAGLRRRRARHLHRPGRAAAGRRPGPAHRTGRASAAASRPATGTACSPAAPPRPPGATSTMSMHWAHGGPTSCENGALLCERHHTAVHEGRFTVARDPGTAVWHTYRPDGTEIHIRANRGCGHHPDARGAGPGDQSAGATGHQQVSSCREPARRTGSPRRPAAPT